MLQDLGVAPTLIWLVLEEKPVHFAGAGQKLLREPFTHLTLAHLDRVDHPRSMGPQVVQKASEPVVANANVLIAVVKPMVDILVVDSTGQKAARMGGLS